MTIKKVEDQAGFTTGKTWIDQIYNLQQLMEKKLVKTKPVHLTFGELKEKRRHWDPQGYSKEKYPRN